MRCLPFLIFDQNVWYLGFCAHPLEIGTNPKSTK
jgi:hypothetical protein